MSGLVTMTPDECSCWGGNIWITDNGGVRFENATEVSLNNVFTGDYDNYRLLIDIEPGQNIDTSWRLRSGDPAQDDKESNYTYQYCVANGGPNATGNRISNSTQWELMNVNSAGTNGAEAYFYGPFLPKPTAVRVSSVSAYAGAYLLDHAGTHSLGNSYHGLTIKSLSASTMTGNLIVMGYAE